MTEGGPTLGERIRAKRERGQAGPREAAKKWARQHVDKKLRELKEYVDQRIEKLAAENGLKND